MHTASIAIIEDNDKIRNYLLQLIVEAFPETNVSAYPNAEEAFNVIKDEPVDVALFDIELPGMSGIECMYKLKAIHLYMQCMMLTVFDDAENIFKAIKAGATSYMLKNTPPAKIIDAINDLRNGGSPMSSQIARKVVAAFQHKSVVEENNPNAAFINTLSNREKEILEWLAKGMLYKEIAAQLFISPETVRKHVYHIYEKLHVNNRIEAVNKYFNR